MVPVETAYYDLLDVPPDCVADDLTSAYRKKALKLHPDKGGSPEEFKAMKAAYDVLKDPKKRQMYDSHGAAIVRAMDGEALEPEVMLEVVVSFAKSASRMVLFVLPIIAAILLFPAVALSLKWDNRIGLNWTLVFVPLWIIQIIVLILVLKLRAFMSTRIGAEAAEDESDRASAAERKRKVMQVVTASACMVVLLLIQEAAVAAKLQGDTQASWVLVLIPYMAIEVSLIYMQAPMLVESMAGPFVIVAMMLTSAFWWRLLRLCTVALLAAKADDRIGCTWTLCLTPMIVGACCKLLWSCRAKDASRATGEAEEQEEDMSSGSGSVVACLSIAIWLSILLLAAGKLDGREYSAFLVFLPFFLLVAQLLCCCTCLACFGPVVLGAFLREEQQKAESGEAQSLRKDDAAAGQNYSTLP